MGIHKRKQKDPQVLFSMPTFSAPPPPVGVCQTPNHLWETLLCASPEQEIRDGSLASLAIALSNLNQINQNKVHEFSAVPACVDNCCDR